jgi:two-component system NtrC family sensor kinase
VNFRRLWSGGKQRVPLWVKLAVFAGLGVVLMHAIHLVVGRYVASHTIVRQQANLGDYIAHLIAEQSTAAILVEDTIALQELISNVVDHKEVVYCLIEKDRKILASSFYEGPPTQLMGLRRSPDRRDKPLVVVMGRQRLLEISHPILEGQGGYVRLGMRLEALEASRRRMATTLGASAVIIIFLGFGAAFIVGRSVARPVREILAVAERFDPAGQPTILPRRTRDEIGDLTEKFNEMLLRLHHAHQEQEQARQKQMETERLVAMGSLVAGVSHEVNNPLAGLKNCQRRLQKPDLPESTRQHYLKLMDEGLERIENVVRQLLDFGRSGPLQKQVTDVGELVRAGLDLIRPLLKRQQVKLKIELGDIAERKVVADRQRIAQALLNLVLNAAYVTPAGEQIRVSALGRDSMVGIRVEDQGPGIDSEVRSRIMDPFFTTKPEGEGSGLGLSVTRTIVEAHGGELAFEFPERGTQVTIWLPERGSS